MTAEVARAVTALSDPRDEPSPGGIGLDLDRGALVERLDDCLLTDEEREADWDAFPDPFSSEEEREMALADD